MSLTLDQSGNAEFIGNVTIQKTLTLKDTSKFAEKATFDKGIEGADANFYKNVVIQGTLSLSKKDVMTFLMPTGSILPFGGPADKVPTGFLLCDGTSYLSTDFPDLYNIIGIAWGGVLTPEITFCVPDLRGQFLRGVSGDSSMDPDKDSRTSLSTGGNQGNSVGSYQANQNLTHNHNANPHNHSIDYFANLASLVGQTDYFGVVPVTGYSDSVTYNLGTGNALSKKESKEGTLSKKETPKDMKAEEKLQKEVPNSDPWTGGWQSLVLNSTVTIQNTGGNESRPNNVYVNYIIKT